jgi:hypothetical protein
VKGKVYKSKRSDVVKSVNVGLAERFCREGGWNLEMKTERLAWVAAEG